MKTILKYLLLCLLLGFTLISCKKKNEIKKEIEDYPPAFTELYRYVVDEKDDDLTFIEVLLVGNGIKYSSGIEGKDPHYCWTDNSNLASIRFCRVGKNLEKIEGYDAYLKQFPDRKFSDFLDYSKASFNEDISKIIIKSEPKDKENRFRLDDILSIKVGKDEDCLFVTLKTPLRDEDKSPATYKLKSVKKSLVKGFKF